MSVANVNTPSRSARKSEPKHVDEFLSLYKKAGVQDDSYDELRKLDKNKNKRKSSGKQPLDMSQVTIDESNLGHDGGGSTPLNESKVSSTPRTKSKKHITMTADVKEYSDTMERNETINNSKAVLSQSKSKKHSNSANILFKENEQIVVKKSKSETSQSEETPQKVKKNKKNIAKHSEEVNEEQNMSVEQLAVLNKKKKNKPKTNKNMKKQAPVEKCDSTDERENVQPKKQNKAKQDTNQTETGTEKVKKAKKKKHQDKPDYSAGEPVPKSPKTEAIVENLENLNIGHNAHTITNLIDEMTVVNKSKKKKARKTANRNKKQAEQPKEIKENTEVDVVEKSEEIKEKKWGKKRWGKKRNASKHGTSVVIDNIPISLLFTYKAVLNELFKECGNVRTVGVAEVYPTEVSKPVFTTTIFFATPEAATKALEKDGTSLKGGKIHVQPSRPLNETTLVMRSYGPLTEQSIVTMFTGAGRIRSIRPVVRGKKTMSTVFVDFDGPDSVQRALERSSDLTIKNKKVKVDRFKFGTHEQKQKKNKDGTDAPKPEAQSESEDEE